MADPPHGYLQVRQPLVGRHRFDDRGWARAKQQCNSLADGDATLVDDQDTTDL